MPSMQQENFFKQNIENQQNIDIKKNKRQQKVKKKSHFFHYLFLFSIVFLLALYGLSELINVYSPKIDVTIGSNDAFTLHDSDADVEMKTIDERLKWIQMEDDLPTVSIRSIDKKNTTKKYDNDNKNKIKEEKILKPPMPKISEIKRKQEDFSNIPAKEIVPLPNPVITKVYLGKYSSLDEAVVIQNKINTIDSSIAPFVKAVNGHYIVQVGSFSDSSRAGLLADKLRANGLYPKITYEN